MLTTPCLLRYRRTLCNEAARRFAPAMIRLDSSAGRLLRCCSSRSQSNMAHLAIEFAVQINIGHVLAEAMTNLAWAYHLQGDELEAKKKFEDAETLSSAFGHPHLYSLSGFWYATFLARERETSLARNGRGTSTCHCTTTDLEKVNGTVVEVEEQVLIESLAPAMRDGLQAKAGSGKLVRVEKLTKKGKLVAYEAKVLTNGKTSEVQVGPDGKALDHEE